jgi:hypothetical protein
MMKRLAIILSVFIIMGIVIPSFTAIAQPTKTPQGGVSGSPTSITPQVSTTKITGINSRIILSYRAMVEVIERITGVLITPDSTLREFLSKITKILPGITKQLTELTEMAESALYSNQKPPRERADTAEQITEDIKRELNRGN